MWLTIQQVACILIYHSPLSDSSLKPNRDTFSYHVKSHEDVISITRITWNLILIRAICLCVHRWWTAPGMRRWKSTHLYAWLPLPLAHGRELIIALPQGTGERTFRTAVGFNHGRGVCQSFTAAFIMILLKGGLWERVILARTHNRVWIQMGKRGFLPVWERERVLYEGCSTQTRANKMPDDLLFVLIVGRMYGHIGVFSDSVLI